MTNNPRQNGWDPLVVPTPELAAALRSWINEWRVDRPEERWGNSGQSNLSLGGEESWLGEYQRSSQAEWEAPLGPLEWLANRLHVSDRVFRRILNGETTFTSLGLADDILQAIERTDLIHNGTIHVAPNPKWTTERWVEWYVEERGGCE